MTNRTHTIGDAVGVCIRGIRDLTGTRRNTGNSAISTESSSRAWQTIKVVFLFVIYIVHICLDAFVVGYSLACDICVDVAFGSAWNAHRSRSFYAWTVVVRC